MASIMTIDESNGSKMNIIVNDKDRGKAFQISYLESLLSIRVITIFMLRLKSSRASPAPTSTAMPAIRRRAAGVLDALEPPPQSV
jgi:hypothetical protein